MINRRHLLLGAAACGFFPALAATPSGDMPAPLQRLAAGWRVAQAPAGQSLDRVGVLDVDWAAGRLRVVADHPAPGRAHGLLPLPDGGFLAVASRPGTWLLLCDAEGRVVRRHSLDAERPARTLGGHAELSADGRWLYTAETDPAEGSGWIGVRSVADLQRVAEFSSGGRDPHQLLRDPSGALWVANGGILRLPDGRKTALDRMAPSLVRIDPRDGRVLDEQRLPDARLSIRHLAWSRHAPAMLGVALQAEHDTASQRRDAPLLAVHDGERLRLPTHDAQGDGYAGDISAGPAGGFVLSGQKAGRGLWWQPQAAAALVRIAELKEPCALASWDDARGVLIGAERGIARWHADDAPRMLPWPQPMKPDNHWALLTA